MGIILIFYFPCRHAGLPIIFPLITPCVLIVPFVRQLFESARLWRDEVAEKSGDE
jgi:hypothetical protein